MGVTVTKFGGSSLADAGQMSKVYDIIQSDPDRRYVVPSAPGKRFDGDTKVTDLLYRLYDYIAQGRDHEGILSELMNRFLNIRDTLEIPTDLETEFEHIVRNLKAGATADYAASRGEYLNGMLLADLLGWPFIDAAGAIFFDRNGHYDGERTQLILPRILEECEHAVIPGFYGSMPNGEIKTFSRGGSDITGSIVARASGAGLYENWTDVSGFMMADPRIVTGPRKIDYITYRELRELSYMGASVLHEDSIFPVLEAAIPINVRNTNEPENPGTMIVPVLEEIPFSGTTITGIAGKKNFTVITIEKDGMNSEVGFVGKVLACLAKYNLSFEHMPSTIDTISIVISDRAIRGCADQLIDELHKSCHPDTIEVSSNMALIATVGRGMIRRVGLSAALFSALADARINVRMIDQGSSEMNLIVGVENDDFENAVRAIYGAFVEPPAAPVLD